MNDTRRPALSQEDSDAATRLKRLGATITFNSQDSRVTSLNTWVIGIVGTSLVFFLGWNIQSIQTLNQTLAVMMEQARFRDEQIREIRAEYARKDRVDRIENHVEAVDGRVTTLERKSR